MTSKTPIIHRLNGVEFRLAEEANLDVIQRYGQVFRVFDDNDSGNISFGVDDGEQRRFIKLAGAHPVNAALSPAEAVANLRRTQHIHRDIVHPSIVGLQDSIEHPPYFGLVFDWTDGELLRRIYTEPFERFRALPVDERLTAFDTVIEAMQHIHDSGYVAVDIYDCSFIYDFDRKRISICDVDAFERKPMVNTMGRMYGSSRFMSPEEYELGARIDEVTNVYTLGAVAFLFFGDERERIFETWDAGDARFNVATRATMDDRLSRFTSIPELQESWFT